jgi:hypothetical protein
MAASFYITGMQVWLKNSFFVSEVDIPFADVFGSF